MNASKDRVFHYHADANAVGGVMQKPAQQLIASQASVSLAGGGGHSIATSPRLHLEGPLTVESATTEVTGSVDDGDGAWTTIVTSEVLDLNLLDVVTAKRLTAKMAVKHPRKGYHPIVVLIGSQFEGFKIHGKDVEVVVNHDVLNPEKSTGYPDIAAVHNPHVRQAVAERSRTMTSRADAPQWLKDRYSWTELEKDKDPAGRGHLVCSFVEEVRGTAAGDTFGHVVHIPDFGNLFLGEIIFDARSFHLTMLRAEMGCANEGTVTVGSARTNGSSVP